MNANRAKRFEGKTALVTGAGSGIGAAVVEELVAEGAKVMALDMAWRARPQDASVLVQDCDVTDHESVARAFSRFQSEFGPLDVVFNNAGIGRGGKRLHETALQDFDDVVAVNIRGSVIVLREALAAMVGRGGSIVNTASTSSFMAAPLTGAYSLTKGAILQLTKQAALEYARDAIRVNCVCPGVTATPLLLTAPAEIREATAAAVPLGRLAEPVEIARVMLFLASDEASYVTGSAFVVDGGKIILTA